MKKIILVFVPAIIGVTGAYAMSYERATNSKLVYAAESRYGKNIRCLKPGNLTNKVMEEKAQCTATLVIKGKTFTSTISVTANTCSEAKAQVKKVAADLTARS